MGIQKVSWPSLLVLLSGCATMAMPMPDEAASGLRTLPPGNHEIHITVRGQDAVGHLAIPANPTGTLVVVAKGYTWSLENVDPLLQHLADQGSYALAMDYRGAPLAWKAFEGAEDTVAATAAVQNAFAPSRTILFGYSMGGEVSGLALANAPPGTYTTWISGSGVMDLEALWGEVPAFAPAIEEATGGKPAEVPDAYALRSPLHQVPAIAAARLSRAYLLHGVADTVVPAEHSKRMYHALADAGVPTTDVTVTTGHDALACLPAIAQCPAFVPVGPAGHEAGWNRISLSFLDDEVAGRHDPSGPSERKVVDGATGIQV